MKSSFKPLVRANIGNRKIIQNSGKLMTSTEIKLSNILTMSFKEKGKGWKNIKIQKPFITCNE